MLVEEIDKGSCVAVTTTMRVITVRQLRTIYSVVTSTDRE
jgi:hypothetical protein